MLAMMSMSVLDTVMVGQLGKDAQGSVSIAFAWIHSFSIIAIGVTRALDPVVAQANGAGNRTAGGQAFARMLALTLPMSVLVIAWQLATPWGARVLGQPTALIPAAAAYAAALCWGVTPMLANQALRQFLQAIGIVRPATVTMLAMTVLKVPLNLWLIPRFGVAGAAYATAVTWWVQLALLAYVTRHTLRAWWPAAVDWSGTARLLSLGLPIGFQMATEIWGFATMSVMMGWLGPTELASHAVAMTLASVAFMLPLGLSTAAATRVGTLLGAGDSWKGAAVRALTLGVGIQLASSLIFLFGAPWLAMPFNPDPDVRRMSASLIRLAGAFQLFDGVQVIAFGILRGAGDVRLPTLANIVGYWFVAIPLAYVLGFDEGGGAVGIWTGLCAGLGVVSGVLLARVFVTARRGGMLVGGT